MDKKHKGFLGLTSDEWRQVLNGVILILFIIALAMWLYIIGSIYWFY